MPALNFTMNLLQKSKEKKESKVDIDYTSFQTRLRCFSAKLLLKECFGVEQSQDTTWIMKMPNVFAIF